MNTCADESLMSLRPFNLSALPIKEAGSRKHSLRIWGKAEAILLLKTSDESTNALNGKRDQFAPILFSFFFI